MSFAATWGDQPIQCGQGPLALSDLRFFVSDLTVIDSDGGSHPVVFDPDPRWQRPKVALVDLEDGTGSCANGTPELNASLHGTAAVTEYVALRFTLGVPFELNHANPLLAAAPLNDAAMHWHWRSGYKFLRAGVTSGDDGTWLHLGSTGCEGTVRNIRSCRSPNRVTVTLPDISRSDRIGIDLAALFAGVDLNDGAGSDCSSGPAETDCAAMFAALDLPFADDKRAPGSIFRVLR